MTVRGADKPLVIGPMDRNAMLLGFRLVSSTFREYGVSFPKAAPPEYSTTQESGADPNATPLTPPNPAMRSEKFWLMVPLYHSLPLANWI